MSAGKVIAFTLLIGAIGTAAAIFGQQWLGGGKGLPLPAKLSPEQNGDRLDRLPDLRLADISGREVSTIAWAGKVLVLNYWATWCQPCLRELPLFSQAQREHGDRGLQVVGIAIDTKEEVDRFLSEHPVDYPILLGEAQAVEISRRLGNRLQGLPFTVIFDHTGKRVHAQMGEVTQASLAKRLAPLLEAQTRGN